MSDNLIREKHLTSLGSAVKNYVDNNFSGGGSLDTVPSSVDGGLWYELSNSAPVLKFYQGGLTYSLTPTLDVIDPQLSVNPNSIEGTSGYGTATLSFFGNGEVSYSGLSGTTYDSNTKVISFPLSAFSSFVSVVTINLSASGQYSAASTTVTVNGGGSGSGNTGK